MSKDSENQKRKSQDCYRLKAFQNLVFRNRVSVRKFFFIFLPTLLIVFSASVYGAETKSAKLLSIYQMKLEKNETIIISQSSQFQTGVLASRRGKVLIIAKEYVPQSITSVKARAQEDGIASSSVRILKWKDRALFYYETPADFHVYSTLGGHLLISKKVISKFDFSKLSLIKKIDKKVARL